MRLVEVIVLCKVLLDDEKKNFITIANEKKNGFLSWEGKKSEINGTSPLSSEKKKKFS
jgi:hypothetical protein